MKIDFGKEQKYVDKIFKEKRAELAKFLFMEQIKLKKGRFNYLARPFCNLRSQIECDEDGVELDDALETFDLVIDDEELAQFGIKVIHKKDWEDAWEKK